MAATPNAAGINVPQAPQNPPIFDDVGRANDYAMELHFEMHSNLRPNPGTVQEVGIAEVYKFPLASTLAGPVGLAAVAGPAVVPAAAIAMPPGAPNWLQPLVGAMNALTATVNGIQVTVNNIQGNVNNLQVDVNNLQTDITAMRAEQHILLLNSQADTEDPLYDPTAPPGQWVHLAAPNPTTRDVLSRFTLDQCVASAAALGLSLLPANAVIMDRRRQIGSKIGVKV